MPHQQVAVLISSARGFAVSFRPMIVLAFAKRFVPDAIGRLTAQRSKTETAP